MQTELEGEALGSCCFVTVFCKSFTLCCSAGTLTVLGSLCALGSHCQKGLWKELQGGAELWLVLRELL